METKLRSLIKTLSWRSCALLITACVGYAMTGRWGLALALGTSDTLVKILLMYLHERAWNLLPQGRQLPPQPPVSVIPMVSRRASARAAR
jgi:uncharacterized membrane protein